MKSLIKNQLKIVSVGKFYKKIGYLHKKFIKNEEKP